MANVAIKKIKKDSVGMTVNNTKPSIKKTLFWAGVSVATGALAVGLLGVSFAAASALSTVSIVDAIVTSGVYVLMAGVPGTASFFSGRASLKQFGQLENIQTTKIKIKIKNLTRRFQNQNRWFHKKAYASQNKFFEIKDTLKEAFQHVASRIRHKTPSKQQALKTETYTQEPKL